MLSTQHKTQNTKHATDREDAIQTSPGQMLAAVYVYLASLQKCVNHQTGEGGRAGRSVCRVCREECAPPTDTKRRLPPDTRAVILRRESCRLFTQVFSFSPVLRHHLLKQWAQCGPRLRVGRAGETGGQLGPSGLLWSECLHRWEEALF